MDISGLIDLAVNLLTHSQFNSEVLLGLGSFVPNLFRGVGIGPDKVKEPAPVDYVGAAKATSEGNLQLAKETAEANKALVEAQTKANRINQYTPYGSLTYNQDPWTGNWQQTMKLTPQAQATLDAQMAMDKQYADIAQTGLGKAQGLLENPNLDFSNLPQLQGIDLGALPQATKNLDFSKLPQLQGIDLNTLPQAPINAGQTAQRAIMSRLQPTLQQRENELAQRLANQGITLGSEAYQREMNLAGQNRNDLELQAAREGITLDQAARMNALNEQNLRYGNQADMRGRSLQEQLAGINLDREARMNALNEQNLRYGNQADMRGRLLQEQAMQKDRPLNLINALRSGAQVQNPTFQPYAMQSGVQQANVAGPDYVKAGMLGYQQGMDAYNAQQARQQQAVNTVMKIGQMFAGGGGGMYG